ncbi:MAG: NADP-dependent 3-hydroxy acid dehydrogenase YdfG [Parvicella sp.]|jgi:NADP-dependent 3-hydroxy acid dehydrogenase YdfG
MSLKTIDNKGGEALVVIADVTKKADMEKLVATTLEEYGNVHAIINNAGLMPLSFVKNLKTDEWEKMVYVNIKGVLNGVAAVLPTLIKNKQGHIVNISSTAAYKYFPGGAVYFAAKAAVKMVSDGLHRS